VPQFANKIYQALSEEFLKFMAWMFLNTVLSYEAPKYA
jgi:hypothetical protein